MIKQITSSISQFIKTTDHLLLTICMVCSSVSFLLLMGIYNAGYVQLKVIAVQIVATIIGLGAAAFISVVNYNLILKFWKLFYPISIALVITTYFIGIQRASFIDDKAWLRIPFTTLTFQPSEILKLAFILVFALHLEKVRGRLNEFKTLSGLVLHGAAITLLIVFQGDHGTAMVFVAIFICMIFCAGLSFKYIAAAVGVALAGSPLLWFFVLDDDKKARVLTVLNPQLDPIGKGYQQSQGLIAIGSGQIWGKGLLSKDVQYVPEMHNDFIFSYAGEALGFIGSLFLILLISLLCGSILYNAYKAKDFVGRFICVGVFAIITFQSFWGIGMCLSLLPVAGLTLPLFSAGGTSVVLTYCAIGLVLNVHRHSYDHLFSNS